MHNNIMTTGSRDRPPMFATGRYAQWQSRFLRYIDTRPNGDALRKCILQGPYTPSTVIIPAVPAIDESLEVPERTAEFGKFTSHDGESMDSYYSRFYKMMNEMIRNNLTVAVMKGNYQKEVNEIHAKRIAKNANPLALVATASPYPDPYYQAPKSHKPYAPTSKQSSSTRSNASTKYKGKKIAKPITPLSESASEEDNTSPRYKNDNQTGQFGNQRTVTVAGARETECRKPKRVKDYSYHKKKMLMCKQAEKCVPLQVEQADWLADTDDEIDKQELKVHYSYMAKIQEVPTADLGTNTEPLEQVQFDDEYNVFANERQHSEQPKSIINTCVVEKVDSNVSPNSPDMCDNDIQTDQNAEDERAALANLIANFKLDVDENKKIQKKLKKANTSLAHELKECKSIPVKTSRTLGESNSIRDSCLIAL
ncbi:hypothetical protein Tco_1531157 [Tanacetum coccineum]